MLHEGGVKEEYITSSLFTTFHVHPVYHSLCVICCLSIHPVIIKQFPFTIILYIPLTDYKSSIQNDKSTRQSPPLSRTANQTQKTKVASICKQRCASRSSNATRSASASMLLTPSIHALALVSVITLSY